MVSESSVYIIQKCDDRIRIQVRGGFGIGLLVPNLERAQKVSAVEVCRVCLCVCIGVSRLLCSDLCFCHV